MVMVSDVYDWPVSRCVFPSWLSATQWTDVTQRRALYVTSGDDVIVLDQRQPPPTPTNHSTLQVCAVSVHDFVIVHIFIPKSK